MTTQLNYRPVINEALSRHRVESGAESPEVFARVYLGHHFKLAPSRMHLELFAMLAESSYHRARRLAVAAPRGHAKTTVVSLAYVLWCLLYKKEMFILLVSATREQAIQLLKAVKDELQTNPRLLTDFPDVAYPPGARPAPKPWRDNQVVLRNGVCIRALGAGQGVRGMKHNQHRPGLIILDDLEDQEQVQSAEQRQKLYDWFARTLLKCGMPQTNVIVVGTILHYDALLANLIDPRSDKSNGWEGRRYQAVESFSEHPNLWSTWEAIFSGRDRFEDREGPEAAQLFFQSNRTDMLEGTSVLWSELESYPDLMIQRIREGRYSFQTEKQNEPVDPEACVFPEESMRFWDDDYADEQALIDKIGIHGRFYGACDPSLGRSGGQGDFTAIVTVLQDKRDKVMYVIGADIRRRQPDETIQTLVEYARLYSYTKFVGEDNQFQQLLFDQLGERCRQNAVMLTLKRVTHSTDKKLRIQTLEPLVTSGQLRFSRRHGQLLDQLRQFPMSAHDDGPDALEMAVAAAHKGENYVRIQYIE